MKIQVIFGSKSDESIYGPLNNMLSINHEVKFEILSAHRNPNELEELLKHCDADIIIAGAGLAAHLPGVIASKVNTPVIGIPVNSVMGGIDALLSIMQMPYGVPVLSTGTNKINEVNDFINNYEKHKKITEINIIFKEDRDHSDYKKEIDRTLTLAASKKIPVTITKKYDEDKLNIVLVTTKQDIINRYSIHVPLLNSSQKSDPHTALMLLDWANTGGTWVCTNNTRNALIYFKKLYM